MTVRLPSFSAMNLPNLSRIAETVGLVLASGSPRRKRLLTEAGIDFDTLVPQVEEIIRPGLSPERQAISMARQKMDSITADGW